MESVNTHLHGRHLLGVAVSQACAEHRPRSGPLGVGFASDWGYLGPAKPPEGWAEWCFAGSPCSASGVVVIVVSVCGHPLLVQEVPVPPAPVLWSQEDRPGKRSLHVRPKQMCLPTVSPSSEEQSLHILIILQEKQHPKFRPTMNTLQ